MPKEEGVVVKILHDGAIVRVSRSDACCGCPSNKICHLGATTGEREIKVKNDIGAKEGENVVIEIKDGLLVKASFVVYIIPVAGLLVGGIFGKWLCNVLNLPLSQDMGAIIFGLSFMICTFGVINFLSKREPIMDKYQPTITNIKNRGNPW